MELHKAKPGSDDRWRVYSYGKCVFHFQCVNDITGSSSMSFPGIRALRNHPTRIKTLAEARSIRGVGEKTAQKVTCSKVNWVRLLILPKKIMEILKTGDLQRIKYERTEDVTVTNIFQGIYGVGKFGP